MIEISVKILMLIILVFTSVYLKAQLSVLIRGVYGQSSQNDESRGNLYLLRTIQWVSLALGVYAVGQLWKNGVGLAVRFPQAMAMGLILLLWAMIEVRKIRPQPSRVLGLCGVIVSFIAIGVALAFWFPWFQV